MTTRHDAINELLDIAANSDGDEDLAIAARHLLTLGVTTDELRESTDPRDTDDWFDRALAAHDGATPAAGGAA